MILLAVMIALGVVVFQSYTPMGRANSPSSPPAVGGQSARQAHAALRTWATNWAADAGIVAVSASLSASTVDVAKESGWTFQVYSPQRRRLAIAVVRGNEVLVLREQAALYKQRTLDLESWEVDSDVLLSHWWNELDGQAVWAVPRARTLSLRLGHKGQPDTESSHLVAWQLSVISDQGDLMAFWEARADTGETMNILNQPKTGQAMESVKE
jgi:hypothetical protein